MTNLSNSKLASSIDSNGNLVAATAPKFPASKHHVGLAMLFVEKFAVPTAEEATERGKARGLTGPALVAYARFGSSERVKARTRNALAMAFLWPTFWDMADEEDVSRLHPEEAFEVAERLLNDKKPSEEDFPTDKLLQCWAVLEADVGGVGGEQDMTGDSSARHPGLSWMSAKKQAPAGKAWSSAIQVAAYILRDLIWERTGGDFPKFATLKNLEGYTVLGVEAGKHKVAVPHIHPRWAAAISLREIAQSAGGDIAEWGALYNTAYGWREGEGWTRVALEAPLWVSAGLWEAGVPPTDFEALARQHWAPLSELNPDSFREEDAPPATLQLIRDAIREAIQRDKDAEERATAYAILGSMLDAVRI